MGNNNNAKNIGKVNFSLRYDKLRTKSKTLLFNNQSIISIIYPYQYSTIL